MTHALAGILEYIIFLGQSRAVGRTSHHYTVSSEYNRPAYVYSLRRFL